MKIKAIILDNDGVLLNSNYAYAHTYMEIAKKYGTKETYGHILDHFGEHPRDILIEILKKKDIDDVFEYYKNLTISSLFINKIEVIPGAKKTLKLLGKKYKLALTTGAIKITLDRIFKRLDMAKYFDVILTSDNVKKGKPDPEILIKAMKILHVKEKEVLYVGDAPNDIKAAKKAGIKFIAVLSGVLGRNKAKKLKADYIIYDINGIFDILNVLERK